MHDLAPPAPLSPHPRINAAVCIICASAAAHRVSSYTAAALRSLMVLSLYVRRLGLNRRSHSSALQRLGLRQCRVVYVCLCVCVCSNGVETEAMLEHGATGERSSYKTCHFLSPSKRRMILPLSAGTRRQRRAHRPAWHPLLWDGLEWTFMRFSFSYFFIQTKL